MRTAKIGQKDISYRVAPCRTIKLARGIAAAWRLSIALCIT